MDIQLSTEVFNHREYHTFLDVALRSSDGAGASASASASAKEAGGTGRTKRRPRGSVKRLCEHLRCHTTFIAHVFKGESHLGLDQAFRVAEYFSLNREATEHFVDLVLLARAGHPTTRTGLEARIARRKKAREELAKRIPTDSELSKDAEMRFFSTWEIQAVFTLAHVDGFRSIEKIAAALGLGEARTREHIDTLVDIGILVPQGDFYVQGHHVLHLGRSSPVLPILHRSWRGRALAHHEAPAKEEDFHYSGAITISKRGKARAREELTQFLEKLKEFAEDDPATEVDAIVLDFFSIHRE